MIEYVLILIISVTMLFVAKGVFSGLNKYMSDYMGGYFKCLIAQGELPQLSVADKDLQKSASLCSINYDGQSDSTLATGGKSIGQANSASKVVGSTKKSASSRGGNRFKSKKPKESSDDSGDSFARGSSPRSSRGLSSSLNDSSRKISSSDADGDENQKGSSKTVIPLQSDQNDRAPQSRKMSSSMEENLKKTLGKELTDKSIKTKQLALTEDEDQGSKPTRRLFRVPQSRDLNGLEEDKVDEGFGIGSFMKWLIIAGIGIALFVLLGGQFMNYRNSDSGD